MSTITGWWEVKWRGGVAIVQAGSAWSAVSGVIQVETTGLEPTHRVTVKVIPKPPAGTQYIDPGSTIIFDWHWEVLP